MLSHSFRPGCLSDAGLVALGVVEPKPQLKAADRTRTPRNGCSRICFGSTLVFGRMGLVNCMRLCLSL